MWTDQQCQDALERWHRAFTERFPVDDVPLPALGFVISPGCKMGSYWGRLETIILNRVDLLTAPDAEIEELICHELAHHWQNYMFPKSADHGEFFHFLMRTMGYEGNVTRGTIHTTRAQRRPIAKMLQVREKINGNDTKLGKWFEEACKSKDRRDRRNATD